MPSMNIIQAVREALRLEMRRAPEVVLLGEDIGALGGVFQVTRGLLDEFGSERVLDMPANPGGIIGAAIGMAVAGQRPVAELQLADAALPAFDQLASELAKLRYRSGGALSCPVVVRMPVGGGVRGGPYHSQSPEALLAHIAGLTVVSPATPADAKGLLLAALRHPDPVIFLEPKRLYHSARGEVPAGDDSEPLGRARVVREGEHCTVLSYGGAMEAAREAVETAAAHGVSCELIDLRTLVPFDIDTLVRSVQKTGRAVVVHEAPRTCGFGAELVASICERAMEYLEAPIVRVTGFDTPFPMALEAEYLPNANRVLGAVRETLEW
ncbi:alpha-ketoacid dehydrogenase subunit beta [Haliangium ochraceum]|uniref:Transketolase central region n=1 Tax=Haliangium ochraceum (strain DSM 14365 / JCM 11303 / SMP-2) TaxID=502025 RepID=D0LTP4_HALO1|nr:alpha-ketoacid dehydrogenase subunit beta [Haliangium ochraceum]ACY15738.1 Transketolase central region [Haliangium ochraceum DSM 14365]